MQMGYLCSSPSCLPISFSTINPTTGVPWTAGMNIRFRVEKPIPLVLSAGNSSNMKKGVRGVGLLLVHQDSPAAAIRRNKWLLLNCLAAATISCYHSNTIASRATAGTRAGSYGRHVSSSSRMLSLLLLLLLARELSPSLIHSNTK